MWWFWLCQGKGKDSNWKSVGGSMMRGKKGSMTEYFEDGVILMKSGIFVEK